MEGIKKFITVIIPRKKEEGKVKLDIIDGLECFVENLDGQQQLQYFKDVAEYLNENGHLVAQELAKKIAQECTLQERCPSCFAKLEHEQFKQAAGEHFGTPVFGSWNIAYCPGCGRRAG
jgi:hypothetical protein